MQTVRISTGRAEFEDAMAIRREVFMDEQGFAEEFDEIDEIAYHAVLYVDHIPAAVGRLFPDENEPGTYVIGRIAVLKEYRGLNLGRKLMARLEEKARALFAVRIRLSAQVAAKGFYEKLHYHSVGEVYPDEGCPHICMEKRL